jgi:2-dehydro-3-deoxyglucarate aldolase/4-hydroxy-2-oxoheptanedioate aldolase
MTATLPTLPPRGDLRRRVLAGEPTIGAFVTFGAPMPAELLARAGFDWLIVDLEHGHATESELLPQLHAIQTTPAASLVRVQSAERLRIGRALDLGADGLMIPRLETPDEIRDTVAMMRFPPAGIRGVALGTRGAGLSEVAHGDVAAINDRILGVFQVESPRAVEHARAIAALDGVDVLFVGPADLSHGMGIPGRITEPAFLAALDQVVAACREHGKAAGILLRNADDVPETLVRGFSFIGIGSDWSFMAAAARSGLAASRSAIGD